MNRTEKDQWVKDFRQKLSGAQVLVLAEFKGMKVAEAVELRRKIRRAQGDMEVAKNTLVKKAIEKTALEPLKSQLTGSTAVAMTSHDPVPLAKTMVDFSKKCPPFRIKGAFLGDRPASVEEIKALAELPGRDALLSQMVGAIKAPLLNFLNLLQGVQMKFLLVLTSLERKRTGESTSGT